MERIISMKNLIKFTINVAPVTKKNSQRIVINRSTGRPMILQSERYLQYEKDAHWFLPRVETIDTAVNVKAIFYMPTKRRVDLVNLQEALLDVLVKYEILADDNSNIVHSMDGSYVDYDKDNPRTEVYIWQITN